MNRSRSSQAWVAVSIVLATLGTLTALGALWNASVEGNWWGLLGLPFAVTFYYWLTAGAWRRSRRL